MTLILNPAHYRLSEGAKQALPGGSILTRDNFETYLDLGYMQAAMLHGKWWQVRRNGATKHWKREPRRIKVPIKVGWKSCGAITERDFVEQV